MIEQSYEQYTYLISKYCFIGDYYMEYTLQISL